MGYFLGFDVEPVQTWAGETAGGRFWLPTSASITAALTSPGSCVVLLGTVSSDGRCLSFKTFENH